MFHFSLGFKKNKEEDSTQESVVFIRWVCKFYGGIFVKSTTKIHHVQFFSSKMCHS